MKLQNLFWIVPIVLIIGLVIGFLSATTVVIPNDLNLTLKMDGSLNDSLERVENLSMRQVEYQKNVSDTYANAVREACTTINYTCQVNVTSDMFGAFEQLRKKYEEAQSEQKVIVKDFCDVDVTRKVISMDSDAFTYLFELNKPRKFGDKYIEVQGCNVDGEVVIDINGARSAMHEGEQISNGNLTITVLDNFIVDIPYLDCSTYMRVQYVK